MQNRSTTRRWQQLLATVVSHGALGVVGLVLLVALACVVTGVSAAMVYALVALVLACTILIAVTALLLSKKATMSRDESSPRRSPRGRGSAG